MFTSISTIVLGLFFLVGSFLVTGAALPLSRRPATEPVSAAQRVILFMVGLVILIDGIRLLLKALPP